MGNVGMAICCLKLVGHCHFPPDTGDVAAVKELIREEQPGIARERTEYLYGPVTRRSAQWVDKLRDRYDGRCQICAWNPRGDYGKHICEAHHLHWLSRGGEDDLDNMVLCPHHLLRF